MLYRFKSKDHGDVIMLQANGRQVLEIIGKDAGPKGIILPEEMPAAIKALEAAIALEKSNDGVPEDEAVPGDGLGLQQRSISFIDMLRHSHAVGDHMVWGV